MTRTLMDPSTMEPGSSMARVAAEAAKLGLLIEIWRMAHSTRTAEEAAAACGCDVAQIVKSLIFVNARTQALALVLVSGRHNADMDFISNTYDLLFTRCDAKRVRAETGFAIGGVAPIGHLTRSPVFVDEALLGHQVVWAAAGRPDAIFSVNPVALAEAIGAVRIRVQG